MIPCAETGGRSSLSGIYRTVSRSSTIASGVVDLRENHCRACVQLAKNRQHTNYVARA